MVIQILIIAFILFALARTFWQFRHGRLTLAWLIFWIAFWILAGVVVLLPQTTSIVASLVGVGRGADLVIYVSLLALFYLVFRLFVRIEEVEREITRFVRAIALEDVKEEENK